jgi:hypothetical protein
LLRNEYTGPRSEWKWLALVIADRFFAQRQLDVRLGWSLRMHGGAFKSRQPEDLSGSEWNAVVGAALLR